MNKYLDERKVENVKTRNKVILGLGIAGFIIVGFMMMAIAIGGINDGEYELVIVSELVLSIILFINIILIGFVIKSNRLMDRAYLYARYFEGDLDGYIYTSDMIKVVGDGLNETNYNLNKLLAKRYMFNFFLRSNEGKSQIVLLSKIAKCECKNCGAIIDKKIHFAGVCPYCGSSDIYAELLNERR